MKGMTDADTPLGGDRRPVRSAAVAWQTVDGETVLLRLREKELLGLNEVGRRAWEMADGTRSIDEMVTTVTAEYRVAADTARHDIERFVRELVALGALEL